jgi:hypothetical protein
MRRAINAVSRLGKQLSEQTDSIWSAATAALTTCKGIGSIAEKKVFDDQHAGHLIF